MSNIADFTYCSGFISYDISQLSRATIESAKISGKAAGIEGTLIELFGPMIIKSVYWGAREITNADFNLDGTEITHTSQADFDKSPEVLKDDLQNVINSGSNRYQLCLYFEMPQNDGNGHMDCIVYYPADILIGVTYLK